MNTAYIGYALIVIAIVFAIISLIPKSERKKATAVKKAKLKETIVMFLCLIPIICNCQNQ